MPLHQLFGKKIQRRQTDPAADKNLFLFSLAMIKALAKRSDYIKMVPLMKIRQHAGATTDNLVEDLQKSLLAAVGVRSDKCPHVVNSEGPAQEGINRPADLDHDKLAG